MAVSGKLHEAMLQAARSIIALDDLHDELRKDDEAGRERLPPKEDEEEYSSEIDIPDIHGQTVRVTLDAALVAAGLLPHVKHRALERGEAQHEALMERLASDPELRAAMDCWMVDFKGTEEPPGVAKMDQMTPERLESATLADFGVMPRLVRAWATGHGFCVSDSESGVDGWLLGIPCSDEDSMRLCRLAYQELGTYIGAGTLSLRIHFWGWKFRDLLGAHEARRFLAARSVS